MNRSLTFALGFIMVGLAGHARADVRQECLPPARSSFGDLTAAPRVVVVRFEVLPHMVDEFLLAYKVMAKSTREEPGCVVFELSRAEGSSTQFWLYEKFLGTEAHEWHMQQTYTRNFMGRFEQWLARPVEFTLAHILPDVPSDPATRRP